MRKPVLLLLFCVLTGTAFAGGAAGISDEPAYASYFEEAYALYPDLPRGILEAVAWTNTRMRHVQPAQESPSCMGLPAYYGVMGMVADGKGHFRENLYQIASLAQASPREPRRPIGAGRHRR